MKIYFTSFLLLLILFFSTELNAQEKQYVIEMKEAGVRGRNLTAIAVDYKKIKAKLDSVQTLSGKSKFQEDLMEMVHYLSIDVNKLEGYTQKGKTSMAIGNGNLAWYYLFDREFKKAENVALKALELDESQKWIYTNLGHAYLLQGNYKAAKSTYKKIKKLSNADGKPYSEVILNDLELLEKQGIEIPKALKIRKYLR